MQKENPEFLCNAAMLVYLVLQRKKERKKEKISTTVQCHTPLPLNYLTPFPHQDTSRDGWKTGLKEATIVNDLTIYATDVLCLEAIGVIATLWRAIF